MIGYNYGKECNGYRVGINDEKAMDDLKGVISFFFL